jgi:hypothetical protein
MKTKALVLTFAVCAGALAAQQQGTAPTPSQELAPIVAVEEQERDLAKAERLYKEAIDGGKLSAAAKDMATLRLAELLRKLGKLDEAKQWMDKLPMVAFDNVSEPSPQDRERQEALRSKAKELVQKALAQSAFPFPAATGIFDEELRRQIEWLGDAAVPEIGAVLAAAKPTLVGKVASDLSNTTPRFEALRGLAGVLWRFGSPAARAQLEEAYRDGSEAFRLLLVSQAARHAPALRELVVKWLNEDPSEVVFWELARSGREVLGAEIGQPGWSEGRRVWVDLEVELLLAAVEKRSPTLRAKVLMSLPGPNSANVIPFSAAAVARACAMVRELTKSTDPGVVRQALMALANRRLEVTPEGFDCIVEHLGRLGDDVQLGALGTPREWRQEGNPNLLVKEVATRLWPSLAAAAIQGVSKGAQSWVRDALAACELAIDGAMLDDLIALQARGHGELLRILRGRLDPEQAMRLVRVFDQTNDADFQHVASGLYDNDLPPEALPLLVGKTEQAVRLNQLGLLAWLVAHTGNPDAVPWLLAQAKAHGDKLNSVEQNLLELGRRTQAEPVRVAMRELPGSTKCVLALLSMRDLPTLERLVEIMKLPRAVNPHPYAKVKDSKPISPFAYVLMDQPDPPHGFTETELLAFVDGAAAWPRDVWGEDLDPNRVATPILKVLAERSRASVGRVMTSSNPGRYSSFQEAIARRIAQEPDLDGPLHRWLLGVLGTEGPARRVVEYLAERERVVIRPELERLLAGDDEERALFAFSVLEGFEPPPDLVALTASKHKDVASLAASRAMDRGTLPIAVALRLLPGFPAPWEIAIYCGNKLAVEAVPALLQLLQHDKDSVREAASEALAKIRAAHEQRSYWDRITKGLDASPTSAVEKLLLQSKPGAPAEQRLLAITSLGTLGVPEALPFLIEWTQDADANVVKAAKDAITQIHLNPRR